MWSSLTLAPVRASLASVMSLAAFSELETADGSHERSLATRDAVVERERVENYAGRSKSCATIKAYASGRRDFLDCCAARELSPLPVSDETVALYLSDMADRGAKAVTIARRLVVISQAHKGADLASPTSSSLVRRVHAGIRRTIAPPSSAKLLPWSPI
jgi:hypothetical protein